MRFFLILILSACGVDAPGESTECAGNLESVCDGRCSWRCVDGRWQVENPCDPCVCFGDACYSITLQRAKAL
jgi:hypothetical protein